MAELYQSLLTLTSKTLRQTPKSMVALGVGMGFLVSTLDTAEVIWPSVSKSAYLTGSCAAFLMWVIVEYAITMAMVEQRRSIRGVVRYLGANLARYSLILLALLDLFLFPGTFRQGVSTAILLVLVLIGVLLVVMLPAWPIEQSQSSRLISPWRALKATKDHRFQLFVMAGLASGMDRFVPTLTAIHDPAQIALSLAENTVVNSFSNLFTAAVAASAFMLAIQNDPPLAGETWPDVRPKSQLSHSPTGWGTVPSRRSDASRSREEDHG